MKPVTDPTILAQLNGSSGMKPVTDPAILAQLNGGGTEPQRAGPQPTFMDRVAASPVGRLAHDAVVQPLTSAADLLTKFQLMGSGVPAAKTNPVSDMLDKPYQAALAANRNTPGYAAARAQADKLMAAKGSGLSDQLLAPLMPSLAGIMGGVLGGSLDQANASADAQAAAQGAYAKANPIKSTIAGLVGGALAGPEMAKLPAAAKSAVPTVSGLKAARDAAYATVDNSTMQVAQPAIKNMVSGLKSALAKRGLTDGTIGNLAPKTATAINALEQASKAGGSSLQDLEIQRRIAGLAAGAQDKTDRAAARIVQDHIDNFVQNLTPADLSGPVDQAALDALPEARSLHARAARAEQLQGLVQKAKDNSSYFTGSGYENSLRSEFRKLARNDRGMARFSKDEQAAIRRVASGGDWYSANNVTRQIGKLAPQGGLTQMLELGAIVGLGPHALAAPVAGALGRVAATKMTKAAAQRAIDTAALGHVPIPAPQSAPVRLPALTSQSRVPYGLFGSMGALQPQHQ